MNNPIKAAAIKEIIRSGSSLPVIVCDGSGTEYIVKLKGAGHGIITNITEYISTSIGYNIDLPVLKPYLIDIGKDSEIQIKNDEFAEVIKKSYGLNICHLYYRHAVPIEKSGKIPDKPASDRIFLFDLFLLNVDRRKNNSDVISTADKIYATDFGSSFLIRSLTDGVNYYNDESILKQIKRSPFYNDNAAADAVSEMFHKLKQVNILSVISEMPDEWLKDIHENADTLKKLMSERLTDYISTERYIRGALEKLKELKVESEDAIKKRQVENRKKFEREILFKKRT